MSEKKGKVKEIAGFVTGDRRVEAAGRVEQEAADPDSPVVEADEKHVGEEEREVRVDHGDLPSGARHKEPPGVPASPVSERNLEKAREAERQRAGAARKST